MFDTLRGSVTSVCLPFFTVEIDAENDESLPSAVAGPSQVEERSERFSVGTYYAPFEMPSSTEEVLGQLEEQGYELTERPQGGGGALLVTRGKFVVDSSGSGMGGVDDSGSSYGFGQGSLNVGYIVARSRWFRVYPLLGIGGGGGGGTLRVETDEESDSSEPAMPGEQSGYRMFNAGIGLDSQFRFRRLSLFAGLRVGIGIQVGEAKAFVPRPFFRLVTGSSLHV